MRIPTPVSKEQADAGGNFEPWPIGEYDFEVNDAADDVSKASGREQIKLTLHVFNEDGGKRTVFDYLGSDEKSQWKVRHFCEAVGLIRHYEKGELDVYDITGKTGRLHLAVKRATSEYPANNTVRDYIAMAEQPARAVRPAARAAAPTRPAARPAAPMKSAHELDDEIPF
jgi:hypothetical protein